MYRYDILFKRFKDENVGITTNFFTTSQGIAVYGDIDSSKFVTLSIPDMFELIQILGIEKGAQLGDLIDPKNGEVIERAKTTQMIVKNENKKTEIFSKLKRLIKKEHREANNNIRF